MVAVFKTNVHQPMHAALICDVLQQHFPGSRIDLDLDDCDKVLRIERRELVEEQVIKVVKGRGFECDMLE